MLQKIIKRKILKTGPQMYDMTKNLLEVEALHIFEYNAKINRNNTKENQKMVMGGLTTHFFPPKAIQRQKEIPPPGNVQEPGNQDARFYLPQ